MLTAGLTQSAEVMSNPSEFFILNYFDCFVSYFDGYIVFISSQRWQKTSKSSVFFLLYNFLVDQFTTSLEANFCRLHIQPFNFLKRVTQMKI